MLSPSAHDSINRIEQRLAQIHDKGDAETLQLPSSMADFMPGVEVALLQLIVTWAAFSREKRLVTSIAKGQDPAKSLAALAAQSYGRAALLAARTVCNLSGEVMAGASAAVRLDEYAPFNPRENGVSACLIVGRTSGAPRHLAPYLRLAVEGERAMQEAVFTEQITRTLTDFYAKAEATPLHGVDFDLPGILYELFANAEEWGCTNFDKAPIHLPLRGMLLRLHRRETLQIAADDAPLAAFLRSSAGGTLLEVSVFDGGVGLAQRYLRRRILHDAPIQEELQLVRECIALHGTSSGSTARGLGLSYVMELANNLRGFLRLRTGRLHLYRDFAADPYVALPRAGAALTAFQFLRDWSTNSNDKDETTAHAYARGATYHLILPMKAAQLPLL